MAADVGGCAGGFHVQDIVAHGHVGAHERFGDRDGPWMLEQVDEDLSMRRDGKDDVGPSLPDDRACVRGFQLRCAASHRESLFFNPLEFLLHARKESILQDGIQMKVALGVEGVILGFIEATCVGLCFRISYERN